MRMANAVCSAAIGAATFGVLLAGGCAAKAELGTAAATSAADGWQDDPARAALLAWEDAVGDDDVRFSVLGPVSLSADRWGMNGPASMAAVEAAGVRTTSPYEPRIVTHRVSGLRQELQVHEFEGGHWNVEGWEGDWAWTFDPEWPFLTELVEDGRSRTTVTRSPYLRLNPGWPDSLSGLTMAWPMVGGRAFAWNHLPQRASLVDWLDACDEVEVRLADDGRHEVVGWERRTYGVPVEEYRIFIAIEVRVLVRLRLEPRARIEEIDVTAWEGQGGDPDVPPVTTLHHATRWFGSDFIAAGPADLAWRGRVWQQLHQQDRPDGDRAGRFEEYRRLEPDAGVATVASADVFWEPFPAFPPAAASVPGTLVRDRRLGLAYTIGEDRIRVGAPMSDWRLVRLDRPIDGLLGPDWERRVVEVLAEGGPPSNDILFPGLDDAD